MSKRQACAAARICKDPVRRASHDLSDADVGIWQGRAVARRFVSPDGLVILAGRTAADNDILTFKLASPSDFWFHVAGASGAHVVVRNPEVLQRLPGNTLRLAASLAAGYSKARRGGRMVVHATRCGDVRKPRGAPAGQVHLKRFTIVRALPCRAAPPHHPGFAPAIDPSAQTFGR
ncbi:MAG: NFACT RNA binding domain-containing protein [Candidatus Binatia bacterium]